MAHLGLMADMSINDRNGICLYNYEHQLPYAYRKRTVVAFVAGKYERGFGGKALRMSEMT